MTEVLEEHDKSAFEIHAFYCGVDRIDLPVPRIRDRRLCSGDGRQVHRSNTTFVAASRETILYVIG